MLLPTFIGKYQVITTFGELFVYETNSAEDYSFKSLLTFIFGNENNRN